MDDSVPITMSRLRWRCRRGMRELDSLLSGWLDAHWEDADPETRTRFLAVLDAEDDALWDWVTGRAAPEDAGLADLIQRIVARQP
jgi:antitoxin CptB